MNPGQRIRQAREKAGLSQTQLANLVGVTQGAVYQWEIDATRPKSSSLGRLAAVLGIDLNSLVAWFDGTKLKHETAEDKISYGGILNRLSTDQRELLYLYTRLSKVRQKALLEFLRKY